MRRAAGGQLFEDHMKFVRSLAIDLKADQTTMILLLVISLFSPDRMNLINKDLVAQEQENYSELLCKYLESKYPYHVAHALYPKLLMKLTDIRNLNEEHSAVLLKVNDPDAIQPLMQEVLDLRDLRNQAAQTEAEKAQVQQAHQNAAGLLPGRLTALPGLPTPPPQPQDQQHPAQATTPPNYHQQHQASPPLQHHPSNDQS